MVGMRLNSVERPPKAAYDSNDNKGQSPSARSGALQLEWELLGW